MLNPDRTLEIVARVAAATRHCRSAHAEYKSARANLRVAREDLRVAKKAFNDFILGKDDGQMALALDGASGGRGDAAA